MNGKEVEACNYAAKRLDKMDMKESANNTRMSKAALESINLELQEIAKYALGVQK